MYNLKKSNSEQQGVEGGCQGLGGESHGEMSVKRYTVPVRTKFSQASVILATQEAEIRGIEV
jgi:hypothetical protein